jgi:energy-coupling factor transporter ATP-binding protein EcfA2
MDNTSPSKSNTLVKVIAWGAVGFAVWSLLPPEWKENINRGIYQSSEEMAAAKRRKDEQQRLELIKQSTIEYFQKHKFTLDLPQLSEGLLLPPSGVKTEPLALDNQSTPLLSDAKTNIDPDLIWLKRIIHPSLVLILGKRGSGKSALAYYLIEIHRYGLKPYVVGIPQSKQHLLPEWVGVASSLEEVPFGAIVIVDEAYLLYHARGSTTQESKEMAKIINLSRQKGQTIIFVSQESRSIDKNIASSANVIIFKEPGILQSEFERPELNHLAKKAVEAFAPINGNKQQWSYLYAPDTNYSGLIKNELPSFWKPELGRMFAGDISTISKPRIVGKLTLQEKMQKAKEMFQQKTSYEDIGLALGVSKGTAFNYVHDYPYCK